MNNNNNNDNNNINNNNEIKKKFYPVDKGWDITWISCNRLLI